MPVHIVMSDFEKRSTNAVSFLTRQKEELGVSPVGDTNVVTETLGLRLSHWHWGGGGSEPSPELSKLANVLRAVVTHTCRLQPVLALSASATRLRENLQLSLVLSK